MTEHIEAFLNYLSVERGLAHNTLLSYGRDLNLFADFLALHGIDSLPEINREHISSFLMQQKDRGLSPNSIARGLAAIKVFSRFLVRERILSVDPTSLVDAPKLWKSLPETLTLNDVDLLLAQPNIKSVQGLRDKAILETLYATGMRVSEAVNLKKDNVNLEIGFLRCVGKGNKERVIPLGKKAIASIENYQKRSRPQLLGDNQSDLLFLNRFGKSLSRQSMWKFIKKYASDAAIKKSIKPVRLCERIEGQVRDNNRRRRDEFGEAQTAQPDKRRRAGPLVRRGAWNYKELIEWQNLTLSC